MTDDIKPSLTAAQVLSLSGPLDGTPGLDYICDRGAWPRGARAPAEVRWIESKDMLWPSGRPVLPAAASGAVAFVYRTVQGALSAVEVEALRDTAKLTPSWRRSYGAKKRSYFAANPQLPTDRLALSVFASHLTVARVLHICEGPVDALAVQSCFSDDRAIAVGGSSNLDATTLPLADVMVIHSDGDLAGQRAAVKYRDQLTKLSAFSKTKMMYYPAGEDAASTIARTTAKLSADEWADFQSRMPSTYEPIPDIAT